MDLKKIAACVLCLILAMALIVPALAEDVDIEISNESTRNVTVLYEEPESFSFGIAPSITLNKNSDGSLTGTSLVTLSANLLSGSKLSVSVEGSDYGKLSDETYGWHLTGTNGNIYYKITSRNPDDASDTFNVGNSSTIISYGSALTGTIARRNLEFVASTLYNQNIKPGNYHGTLTFVISKTNQ